MKNTVTYIAKQTKLESNREFAGGLIDITFLIKEYSFDSVIDIRPYLSVVTFDNFTTENDINIFAGFTEDLFNVSDYVATTTSMNGDGSVSVRYYREIGYTYSYDFINVFEYNMCKRRMGNHISKRHSGLSVKDWDSIVRDCYIRKIKKDENNLQERFHVNGMSVSELRGYLCNDRIVS
jgi:hypothetical protein